MSRILGRDTSPEIALRHALWRKGCRYRKNMRVFGFRPDLVFTRAKVAVFVDGCFWHGCPEHYVRPRGSNPEFWASKLRSNIERDEKQTRTLEQRGWRVSRLWEHEVRNYLTGAVEAVVQTVRGQAPIWTERWAVVSVQGGPSQDLDLLTVRELRSGATKNMVRRRVPSIRRCADDSSEGISQT